MLNCGMRLNLLYFYSKSKSMLTNRPSVNWAWPRYSSGCPVICYTRAYNISVRPIPDFDICELSFHWSVNFYHSTTHPPIPVCWLCLPTQPYNGIQWFTEIRSTTNQPKPSGLCGKSISPKLNWWLSAYCSNSSELAMELLQFCTEPLK